MFSKTVQYLFLIILSLGFLSSCEEAYVLDTGDFESKLVVNCLFSHDTPWNVHVSNSNNIIDQDTEIENIENATVEIFYGTGDSKYELFHQGNGNYAREDYKPAAGGEYQIKVSAKGYKTVTSSGYVPELSLLTINNFSIVGEDELQGVEVDFDIEDKSTIESYFIWEVISLSTSESNEDCDDGTCKSLSKKWIEELTNNPEDLIDEGIPIFGSGEFGDGKYNTVYNSLNGRRGFSDTEDIGDDYESLDGPGTNTLETEGNDSESNILGGGDEDGSGEDGNAEKLPQFELRVMSISQELFDCYNSIEAYIKDDPESFSEVEISEVYNNIKNGYGIFAGYSEAKTQF